MKKIYVPVIAFVFFALMLSGFVSCKKDGFLGRTITSSLDESTVFADSSNSVGFLAGIYTNIGVSYLPYRFGNGGLDVAGDESEISSTDASSALQFATGTVNAGIITNDVYRTCYSSVRAVNILLKNLSKKSGISDDRQMQMRAEARFLRAWYYSILLKHYGGVPIVGDTVYAYTDIIPTPRKTYSETVQYILQECDAAKAILPTVQVGLNYGRITKGACLALKARVLLYAASPQFNDPAPNGGDETSLTLALKEKPEAAPLVAYTDYQLERWNDAAKAADEYISTYSGITSLFYDTAVVSGTNNKLRPGLGFQSQFRNRVSIEAIFTLMRPDGGDIASELETLFLPPSRGGSRRGGFPYQELVDAFPMRNGKPITDPSSGYDPQNPYKDRDPRLDFSVVHDQTRIAIRAFPQPVPSLSPVNMFTGNFNGVTSSGDEAKKGTPTGYYQYKMLDSLVPGTYSIVNVSKRCIPLIRYAEILLNYAEAQNEFSGPDAKVYERVEAIRKRAGLNPYKLPTGLTKEQMREVIHNERRIELAFEEHRFWDVRRWKQASAAFTKQMTGLEVLRNGSSVTYRPYNVRKHDFRSPMYLWPFPQIETGRSPQLIQNPGYL